MPKKDIRAYLFDVLSAIEQIENKSAGFKLQDVEMITNKWFLERGLSIIGEALYQASKIDDTLAISDLRKIITTRHIMVHDYDIIDSVRILVIIQRDLPVLKVEVESILKNMSDQEV